MGCRFEFRKKLPYERISGNYSDFINFGHQVRMQKKVICCISKFINLGCRFEFRIKNYPMKEFRAIFPISSILVIRSTYAKKGQFSILPVIQNIWDLHKFGLQIWIHNAKITPWKNFGQFFPFHQFWSKCMRKKASFSILAVFQNVWDLHKFGCRFEFRMQKLPYERISGNFSDFIDFGHQVRVCKKRSFLNISCNSKYMGLT